VSTTGPVAAEEFATLMAPLGPFEPCPRLAVAVSGGADSTALALLAHAWARARGGSVRALIVDHGLRDESAAEAALTRARLMARGIAAEVLTLQGLARGPALAARARAARYRALEAACCVHGIVHLLLGHHAGDQAETLAIRAGAGSGPAGLAAMAALSESAWVRRLRPLLAVPPARLRATLRAAGIGWVEDPSNADPATLRARLRAMRGDPAGTGAGTHRALATAAAHGAARAAGEHLIAAVLARRATLYPEGYAILTPGALPPPALAALLRVIGGRDWAPAPRQVARLAAALAPATLGGVRLLPAGRRSPGGWLVVREAAAVAPPVPATPGAVWDGRFRIAADAAVLPGAELGALGEDYLALPGRQRLAASVLPVLPAVRVKGAVVAVPHLGYPDAESCRRWCLVFAPGLPLAGAAFVPARLAA
jgi:tRNA(Ile)-lysidine synthase